MEEHAHELQNLDLLTASLVALLMGPVAYRLVGNVPRALAFLDGLSFCSVVGLVLVHVLPEAIERAGALAAVAALFALAIPFVFERLRSTLARAAHTTALVLITAGIAVHSFIDGLALSGVLDHHHGDTHGAGAAPLAVVLHRFPVGLTLWAVAVPRGGARQAWLVAALIAGATLVGYTTAALDFTPHNMDALGVLEGLLAGSLLHVVLHTASSNDPMRARFEGLGGLVGIAIVVVYALTAGVPEFVAAALPTLVDLAMEAAPALLLAYLASGLVYGLFTAKSAAWMSKGGLLEQSARGMLFGLPLPICSCGVVPLYHSLVKRGAPSAAAAAFLVATPELGVDAVLVTIPLLGGELAAARVLAAAVVALAVGYAIGRLTPGRPRAPAPEEIARDSEPLGKRLRRGLTSGFTQVVDETVPWIVVGIVLAALLAPHLDLSAIGALPYQLDVLLFALLGLPIYVCATGATPLVAVLVAAGASPGAGMAFLLAGPATNIVTYGTLAKLHGPRIALLFGAMVAAGAVAAGVVTNLALEGSIAQTFAGDHAHQSVFRVACLAAVGLLVTSSWLRMGPRNFVRQLGTLGGGAAHSHGDHDHSHHGAHAHEHHHHHGESCAACDLISAAEESAQSGRSVASAVISGRGPGQPTGPTPPASFVVVAPKSPGHAKGGTASTENTPQKPK